MNSFKNDLGIFVTCFDEVEAIRYALASCRKFYPTNPIYLTTESDKDFSFLSELGNIQINKGEDTMGGVLGIRHDNDDFRLPDQQAKIKKATFALIERLELAIPFLDSEYIILHCPDTLIRGKLNIPSGTGLLGSTVNKYFSGDTNNIIVKNGGIPISNFGAVPAIFSTNDFLKAKDKLLNTPNLIDELCYSFYAVFSHDIIMPILFALIGKLEEFNPDITECGRNPLWEHSHHPLVHQFRRFYPQRTAKYSVNQQ
jgi:hypothetical protein